MLSCGGASRACVDQAHEPRRRRSWCVTSPAKTGVALPGLALGPTWGFPSSAGASMAGLTTERARAVGPSTLMHVCGVCQLLERMLN